MKNMYRCFLSLVLCMCMVFVLLPNMAMPAYAANSGTVIGLADESIGLSFSALRTTRGAPAARRLSVRLGLRLGQAAATVATVLR